MEVLVPVSVGELVDKITILRIKEREIRDPSKLNNVKRELTALLEVCAGKKIDPRDILAVELESVNARLWQIEDEIRDEERAKRFGAKFVELARAVYVTNDERFLVKAKINAKYGSLLREEKSYQPY